MTKLVLLAPVLFLSLACGSAPGYLSTDVLEPEGLGHAVASGVRMQGEVMTEGTLTCVGEGDLHQTYIGYVDSMRKLGWAPKSADGDDINIMKCTLCKDTRQADVSFTTEAKGAVKVVVTVGPAK